MRLITGECSASATQSFLVEFRHGKNEETTRSGFSEVGIGIGESPNLEAFGKSQFPVQYDGCYKIYWNGRGITNASFNYINI